ncbi:MAG TPA: N-acetylmuramoyl-L-alanine amidase [Candidatus Binatia bacterium]|jgi:N-acetylmuramoyl-L-alanine amidase
MNQSFRSGAVMLLGILCLCGPVSAQETRRRQESPRPRGADTVRDLNPPTEGINGGEAARLTAIRYLSADQNTRVVLEVSRPVRYDVGRLPGDAAKGLPPRIYVDIRATTLAMESQDPINVQDGALRQIRVGQFNHDTVRVVLDIASPREYSAFLLPEPFRVVVDIQGNNAAIPAISTVNAKTSNPAGPAAVAGRSSKPQTTGIRKIVLDPGHGGKDPGAIGVGGVAEKDIVLSVAKKLADRLRRDMGIEVVLTRTDDRFIPLEDRTAVANAQDADLFISLHMNASHNGDARGIETYYLDNTTDEASIRLAARENATSRKNVSDLQFILSDMTQNMKLEDSVTLAHRLQGALVGTMGTRLPEIKDLGVKRALFYVLVGARMPSVLVEMFFITNRDEGRAMSQSKFQDSVADSLYDGIQQYNHGMLAAKTL